MALLATTDIDAYLNAQNKTTKFAASGLTATASTNIIANAEAVIKSYLPEQYRRLMTRAPGLYLTREATDGENKTFSIPTVLRNATTTQVWVWVDYNGTWRDRIRDEAVDATVTSTSITLDDALLTGQVAIAEINHTFDNPPQILKHFATLIAVQDLYNRLPTLISPSDRTWFEEQVRGVREDLRALRAGKMRIDEWDALDLIEENETVGVDGFGLLEPTGW